MDIPSSITHFRTSRLYTRKAFAEKTGIDIRHLIAVEEHRQASTPQDIAAINRAFRVKNEVWIK